MKKMEAILFGVSGIGMLWILASWVEVILFNLEPGHVYSFWNLFTILMK